jgi:hypothetical protein
LSCALLPLYYPAMNEAHSHGGHATSHEHSRFGHNPSTVVLVGAGMGIAGSFLGLAIFLAACFGLEGSFLFSPLPFVLGLVGLIVCIVGAVRGKGTLDDTQVLGAMFFCFFAVVGGLLEMSVRYKWAIFAGSAIQP